MVQYRRPVWGSTSYEEQIIEALCVVILCAQHFFVLYCFCTTAYVS